MRINFITTTAPKKNLLLFSLFFIIFSSATAQQNVSGKVVDALNQPLANVSVVVKGNSNKGTTTDNNGDYTITASSKDVLVFSFVGYGNAEKRVGNERTIDISLSNSGTSMNEVVVIGYGSTSRKNLTLSIAKIDPKNVPSAANNSVAQLLFGRAAGLRVVQQSAEPGGNINLAIRG
ncbi:MAG: carboxypeptidase-like regulatory domain-containing protein, partial [Ginsengibacter sp.]